MSGNYIAEVTLELLEDAQGRLGRWSGETGEVLSSLLEPLRVTPR